MPPVEMGDTAAFYAFHLPGASCPYLHWKTRYGCLPQLAGQPRYVLLKTTVDPAKTRAKEQDAFAPADAGRWCRTVLLV
jgi:hypothetical protein